jgi:hypothetical protein
MTAAMRLASCTVVLLVVSGCGGGDRVKLYPVTGSVSVDGQPPEGLVLIFHPEGAGGQAGSASTDASGSFRAVFDGNPGLPAGRYAVTANWPDPAKRNEGGMSMGQTADPPDLLKRRYALPTRSQIKVEVTDKAVEMPAIELTTKQR